MQLVQTLVFPHFEYAALIHMDVDLTKWLNLQIDNNACIRFVIGNIPFMPPREITSHVTELRQKLGWILFASRKRLKLIALLYEIQYRKKLGRLFVKTKSPEDLPRQLLKFPPAIFEYVAPRTHALDVSFTISSKQLANRLSKTDFDLTRFKELKTWVRNIYRCNNLKSGVLT